MLHLSQNTEHPGGRGADIKQFKVSAVQMAPVQNNTAATIDKVVGYMEEAAREGAKIVAFPEAIVPGYP